MSDVEDLTKALEGLSVEPTTETKSVVFDASSKTGVVYDERCLLHQADYAHFESPLRMSTTFQLLGDEGILKRCKRVAAKEIKTSELQLTHGAELIQQIADLDTREWGASEVDSESEDTVTKYKQCIYTASDTFMNMHSGLAARLSAGGLLALAKEVVQGTLQNGFSVMRPPGHHAEESKVMGFCLYNNVAVTANALLADESNDIKKILIVDWDVHHGNGTQDLFYNSDQVMYVSIHRSQGATFYPMTGVAKETGGEGAEGYNINVPLEETGLGDEEYVQAFDALIVPIAEQFQPDLVIISAGFDCGRGDPLGGMEVTPECLGDLTRKLMSSTINKDSKVVMALEGGYNVNTVSRSVVQCMGALLGDISPNEDGKEAVEEESFISVSARELRKIARKKRGFHTLLTELVQIHSAHWTLQAVKPLA